MEKLIVSGKSGRGMHETRLNVLSWLSLLIPLMELFSLQYCIFTEVYIRRITGSPSEGWNKIMSKSYIEYKELETKSISWLSDQHYFMSLASSLNACIPVSVEPGGARYFNSVLWCDQSDGDGTKMWHKHDPNHRTPVKGLLLHSCLQARLLARDRANLEHQ